MPDKNRRAGIIYLKVDGEVFDAKGNFTYNLGNPKREGIPGADRVHGYMEKVQVPFIEGEITDSQTLDLGRLQNITDATVTLELSTGQTVILKEAWYSADGDGNTEEGNIQVRFEGMSADKV